MTVYAPAERGDSVLSRHLITAFLMVIGSNGHELWISNAQKMDSWSKNVISGLFQVNFR